jgi:hypothetical protein
MRHLFAVSFAFLVIGTGSAGISWAEQSSDLAGEYVMRGRGVGPGDSPYEGTCSLRGDGPVLEVSCFNQETGHTYVGRGLASGETLSITIGDVLSGDHGGVFVGEYLVVYRRGPNGLLEGTWVETRGGASGVETLTRLD